MNLLSVARERFQVLGRLGKRGLIYTLVSLIGIVVEMSRFGFARPFPLILWLIVLGIGLTLLFFMRGPSSQ